MTADKKWRQRGHKIIEIYSHHGEPCCFLGRIQGRPDALIPLKPHRKEHSGDLKIGYNIVERGHKHNYHISWHTGTSWRIYSSTLLYRMNQRTPDNRYYIGTKKYSITLNDYIKGNQPKQRLGNLKDFTTQTKE